MRRVLCWASLLPLLVAATGCWSPRYFAPRENRNGTGPAGDLAAVYVVEPEASAGSGEVRVWSEGAAARFDDDGTEVVDLHVGFEVENNGDRAIQLDLDALECEELMVDGLLQEPIPPQQVTGDGFAPPGLTTRVDVVFRPPTTYPRSVDSFAVRFRVQDAEGNEIGQVTPFAPVKKRRRRRGAGFGPGWGAWWGPGWGGPFWGGFYGFRGGWGFRGACW